MNMDWPTVPDQLLNRLPVAETRGIPLMYSMMLDAEPTSAMWVHVLAGR